MAILRVWIGCILLISSGCGNGSKITESRDPAHSDTGNFQLSIPLSKALQPDVSRVEYVISVEGRFITRGEATRVDSMVQATVEGLEPGSGRQVRLNVYDSADSLTHMGFTTIDVVAGQTAQANIVLKQLNSKMLIFDGLDDYVSMPIPGGEFGNNFTIEAWIKIQGIGGRIASVQEGFDLEMVSDRNGSFFDLRIPNHSVKTAPSSVITQQWQHIAGVYDGLNLTIYLNGNVVGNAPFATTISFPSRLLIGAHDDPNGPTFWILSRPNRRGSILE